MTPLDIISEDDMLITDEQLKEILRREAAFEHVEMPARLWDEVLAELEQKYKS